MPQRHTGGAEVWLDLILILTLHGLSGQLHTMAPLSVEKTLVPTKKEAGVGPCHVKRWKEIKLSKRIFGQRDGVAWLVDRRPAMETQTRNHTAMISIK